MTRAVVITSGGLDSLITIKLMQKSGIPFRAVHFDIGLTYDKPIVAGMRISKYFGLEDLVKNGIEIDRIDITKEFYAHMLNFKSPANACLEHKVFIMKKAKEYMQKNKARFVVSGDVIDQRPLVQSVSAFEYTDKHSGMEGLVFRPLSALSLPESIATIEHPELKNILCDFKGFSAERELMAKELGIIHSKSSDFSIQEQELDMGRKAFEVFEKRQNVSTTTLNRVGLHIKLDDKTRCVIGRTPFESNYIKNFFEKLPKKEFAFSVSKPAFLFGFVYGAYDSSKHDDLSLGIFAGVLGRDADVQILDGDGALLGVKPVKALSKEILQKYIIHTNDLYCPVTRIDKK